jgi:hypothetical protein
MKRITVLITLISILLIYGFKVMLPKKTPTTVSCYYDKTVKEPLVIYDGIQGNVIDSLYNTGKRYSWYNLLVSESKGCWFKVDSLFFGPAFVNNVSHKNCWVKSGSIKVGLWQMQTIGKLYVEPKLNSKFVDFEVNNAFGYVQQVENGWAEVTVPLGNKMYRGWVPRNQQCGWPWTICN